MLTTVIPKGEPEPTFARVITASERDDSISGCRGTWHIVQSFVAARLDRMAVFSGVAEVCTFAQRRSQRESGS